MIGLIKKDLLMIKSNIKLFVVLIIVYGFLAFQGEMDLPYLLPFMCVMIMISTFSYDSYNKWDAYVVTLPDGRRNCVRAKYLTTIILIAVASIIVTILEIMVAITNKGSVEKEILFTIFGTVFATSLLLSIMYPAIYKFGVERARIGIFIVVFIITAVCALLMKFVDYSSLIRVFEPILNWGMIILPGIMVVVLYVSCKISESIYMKKDF